MFRPAACLTLLSASLFSTTSAFAAPNVVVSIKPLHSLVASVMQGAGEPTLLIEGATSPHDFSLRPSQVRAISNADVVFWIDPSLEGALTKTMESVAKPDVSYPLLSNEMVGLDLIVAVDDHDHHHDDDHGDEHGDEHGDDHGDEQGAYDPHVWLGMEEAKRLAGHIASVLALKDAENVELYRNNAVALIDMLDKLQVELDAVLEPAADTPFFAFHDAYRYFTRSFSLPSAGSMVLSEDLTPSVARIRTLQTELVEAGVTCLYAEPQFPTRILNSLREVEGLQFATLDPLGADLEAGPDHYFQTLRALATNIAACSGRG